MLVEAALGLALFLFVVYLYVTRKNDYWRKKGLEFIPPTFPFGYVQDVVLGKLDPGKAIQEYYTKYKAKGLKYVGGYALGQPTLILLDLDLCKQILTKDFHHFMAREMSPQTHEHISKHLFALEGAEWKNMRTKLTPTFTSGKMKNMVLLMQNCVKQLQDYVDDKVLAKGEFEVKDLISRFTTDIIATCAFGLDVNSIKERDHFFYKAGQLIFVPKKSTIYKIFMLRNFPILSRILKIGFYDPEMIRIFTQAMKDTVEYRKSSSVSRNDFVDLLLKVKENKPLDDDEEGKSAKESDSCRFTQFFRKGGGEEVKHSNNDELTLEEMTAQAFVFFAAGFETSGSTTSFCLYELARHPEIQARLRKEVDEVLKRHGGEVTYQSLQEMAYMDQVVNETLRMYASLPFLTRKCTSRYEIPGTGLVIDEGVRINVPTYAFHHDPEFFPQPHVFDPDRFSESESQQRHHYAFLPFGEGPRICIGMRFGRLQVKAGLTAIVSRYELSPAPSTPEKLDIDPRIVFTTPKHPFSLKISRKEDK